MDFLKEALKATKNEYAGTVDGGIVAGDVNGFIDTGSYILNAQLSGSIYDGVASNKIHTFAGESGVGKTFLTLSVCKHFLKANPEGVVFYFETESAITSDMIKNFGVDPKRIAMCPVATVQEFRTQAVKILEKYMDLPKNERKPIIMCLDSLGMLSTTKEMEDVSDGKETRDMTRAQLVKATFRVLTLKLGLANVALLVTNHTYATMGLFSKKQMSGGSGLVYAGSGCTFLSRKKEKEGTEIVGNIIHCKNEKGRLTRENTIIDAKLTYEKGLDRYYGLVDLALEAGIWKKVSTRVEVDGTKYYEKVIYKNPEKFFTDEVLKEINDYAAKKFLYGNAINTEEFDKEEIKEENI